MAATLIVLGCLGAGPAFGSGENSPVGVAVAFGPNGVVHSGGSYSTLTGSAMRTVPDLAVPGAVGAYPLVFSRTSTSRSLPGEGASGHAFGEGGSWRHSYAWGCYLDSTVGGQSVWRVHHPDGSVILFVGVVGPTLDPYMRCTSAGVSERLEAVSGNSDLILHLTDGGRVYFQYQGLDTSTPPNPIYQAIWIFDPYNQVTTLTYNTSGPATGRLKQVTEPAGRSLQITWGPFNGETVIGSVTASNGQAVVYFYSVSSGSPAYTCLTSVFYHDEPAVGQNSFATYTYQADNTGAGWHPLLLACNDPHFAGPMPRIRYAFAQGGSIPYGQIQAEIDDASGATVSSYTQSNLTEATGDGFTSSYAYNGYLQASDVDYEGNQASYGYDANAYLNSVVNRNGHAVSITREPLAGKRTVISRVDPFNNQPLTTVINYGGTAQAPYPINPYWVMSITDPRGHQTTYTRDGNHQVTRIDYPDGTFELFSYNGFGQVTGHQKTDQSVYLFFYDGAGNLIRSTDTFNNAAGHFTYYYYDSTDRLAQVTDYNGHNTFLAYTGRHLLTRLTHDDGTHVDFTYDVYGNRTTISDEFAPPHVTTITYDNHRRPTSVQVPVNTGAGAYRTTTFGYARGTDSTGNAHTGRGYGTMTLPSGKQFQRVYTGTGRLRSITKGLGSPYATTDTYYYDKLGNPMRVIDANNITQAAYAYDGLDRRSTLTDANGHVTNWSYYPAGSAYAGWLQTVTAPGTAPGATVPTSYTAYDVMGRLQSTTDPSGRIIGRSYDACGRLQFVSDANGGYSYGYDVLSRRASFNFPDGSSQAWTYDGVGNALTFKNRAGSVRTTVYDDRNRPAYASWNDNTAPATAWAYDAAGRVSELDNWYAALHYTYDDGGLMLSERDTNALANNCVNTTGFSYDGDGNVAGVQYPAGDFAPYNYDGQNRCLGLGTPSFMWSLLFFQGEQVCTRALANGVCTEYWHQANGRVSEVWHHHGVCDPEATGWPGSNISAQPCGYLPDGQLSWSEHQYDGGASGSALEDGRGDSFAYGADGSLSAFGTLYPNSAQTADAHGDSAANPGNLQPGAPGAGGPGSYANAFAYDGAGNRAGQTTVMGNTYVYAADGENRYNGSYYDGNGNTSDSAVGWTYAFDAEGMMTSARRQSDGYTIQFAYDGAGRLIYQGDPVQLRIFCYAGAQRIEERSLNTNASLYRYFFDAPGSDRITFRETSVGAGPGPRLYYQYDARGSTTHVSDDGGNVVEAYRYDAFGTPFVYDRAGNYLGNTGAQDNRYLFHGSSAYEWVPLAGLYYCRARMYLPVHGRFLQPDPSGFAGGDVNLYRYCGNDPVNGSDPSGLEDDVFDSHPVYADGGGGNGGFGIDPGTASNYTPTGSNIPLLNGQLGDSTAYPLGFSYQGSSPASEFVNYTTVPSGNASSSNNNAPDYSTPPVDKTIDVVYYGFGGGINDPRNSNNVMQVLGSIASAQGAYVQVYGRDQQSQALSYVQSQYTDGSMLNVVGYSLGAVAALNFAGTLNGVGITVDNLVTIDPVAVFGGQFTVPPNVINATNYYQVNGGLQGILPGSFGNFRGTYVNGADNYPQPFVNHPNIPVTVFGAVGYDIGITGP